MGTIILIGSFFILLVIGVPVALAILTSSMITVLYLDIPIAMIVQQTTSGISSFPLLAIPFFILAGEIMNEGGISRKLVRLSDIMVGRLRGGLSLVNIQTSTFFSGISGSALADTSSIGSIMIPMMKKKGYDADYSISVTASSSVQGLIIPPSHNMIIYSLAAGGVSISSLFLAGIVPGLILGVALMILSYAIAVKKKYPKEDKFTAVQARKAVVEAVPGLITGLIIIGGVITGFFTVTESAAIACLYAFLISFIGKKSSSLKQMGHVLLRSTKTLGMVMFLIAASSAFAWLLAYLKIPSLVAGAMLSLTNNTVLITLLIILVLLILGTILDVAPLILISTPILLPIATEIGMDPVHYGIVMMLTIGVGLITPPVGAALFISCAIGDIPVEKVIKSLLPFYGIIIVVIIIIAFIPSISMMLPDIFSTDN